MNKLNSGLLSKTSGTTMEMILTSQLKLAPGLLTSNVNASALMTAVLPLTITGGAIIYSNLTLTGG